MKDPHALWRPQDDCFHPTNAIQGFPWQGDLRHRFPIQTGVRQDACSRHCSLISAIEECPGKQSLEDCDFAGDIALLEKQHEDIQSKTEDLVKFSKDI